MSLPIVSSSQNHTRTQVNALSDPTSSLGDWIDEWFGSWGAWVGEREWGGGLLILVIILIFFSCICLYYCCGFCLQCSQRADKWAPSVLMNLLLMVQHIVEQGVWDGENQSWSMECWRRSSKESDPWLTRELHPCNQRALITPTYALNVCFASRSHSLNHFQGCRLERTMWCWDRMWVTEPRWGLSIKF